MSQPPAVPTPAASGLQQDWVDADDQPQRVADATVARLGKVIGEPPADLDERAPVVTRRGRPTGLRGRVVCEDGTERELDDVVPEDFPLGYHRLLVDGTGTRERRLVVSPGRCWLPPERSWGWAVQLYAVWSAGSRGIGDLGDLATLCRFTEDAGGGFVVVNPLHAVAPPRTGDPDDRMEASPYLPATRRYRNPVYLRVADVDCADAAPEPGVVDRDAAWAWKEPRLRAAYRRGTSEHPDRHDQGYDAWRAEQGEELATFALWMTLAAEHGGDWRAWPEPLRDPAGRAARQAVAERADEVDFQAWLQWRLAEQLTAATGGLTVVQDLPIGVSGGGADAWAWQGVMADGVTVGCPPDAMNARGQDWGSPPLVPWRLREADYEPFVQAVRATIAGAGGLRIDHVMGLFRLWWIPDGLGATEGCYVRYPAEDLLDIVCLESHRARAVVVGEDLGTVEDGVLEMLAERGMLGYRLLWFEEDAPGDWSADALAAVTTHDLPTVAGLWTGSDADDLRAVGAMDEADIAAGRADLVAKLGDLPADATAQQAVLAAYRLLAQAPSRMVALSLDDALGHERRPNVPGTTERDNWRVALPVPLETVVGHAGPVALVAAVTGSEA